ncbi:MAG: MBL fold metallo-hydrolase [Mastigocoleus sp. MO_167.B18]|nr:MBL fold metallo-hydrolase [Mastigocoleus sp. MO_167.B18]
MPPLSQESSQISKSPQAVFDNIFAFSPNRDTLGGTSYLILEKGGNILVDCPAADKGNEDFLRSHGGIRWFFITHRGAIGKAAQIQSNFECEVIIQEQEAYLLPSVNLTTFSQELTINSQVRLIWTPGHSPGSSCLYYKDFGGVLFSGRHLLPNQQGKPVPLRNSKTFHWPRQLKSVQILQTSFTSSTLQYILPGANTGYLRGKRIIDNAYPELANLDIPNLLLKQAVV